LPTLSKLARVRKVEKKNNNIKNFYFKTNEKIFINYKNKIITGHSQNGQRFVLHVDGSRTNPHPVLRAAFYAILIYIVSILWSWCVFADNILILLNLIYVLGDDTTQVYPEDGGFGERGARKIQEKPSATDARGRESYVSALFRSLCFSFQRVPGPLV
jgi:hypothetical protein